MCGIAGLVSQRNKIDLHSRLRAMSRALAHRGPDGEGALVRQVGGWDVALAHTRLAILDLSSAGRQPMSGLRKPCWLSYNGEIYNFKALRRELQPQGQVFLSQTDSEVLLRAYETWGVDAIPRLRGMFGFALWDEKSRRLILARDTFGIKPLYYYRAEGLFIFASELRALLASGLLPKRMDMRGVASFLHYGSVEAPNTIMKDANSVMPGHYLRVDLGEHLEVEEVPYCSVLDSEPRISAPPQRKKAAGMLRDILEESIQLQMVSDVPLGIFLSGGVDSSALVALASSAMQAKLKTFSVVFDEINSSEAYYSRLVARKFDTDHQEILLSKEDLLETLPGALASLDQPSVDGINTFVISKAVRNAGVKVALSGLGGDELFAGYASFKNDGLIQNIARVPRPLRKAFSRMGSAIYGGSVGLRKTWEILGCDGSPYATYDISRELFSFSEIKSLLGSVPDRGVSLLVEQVDDRINAISAYEIRGYMANTLLRDTDCMSMAHSLEVRVPFIDPMVVRYVLGLPGSWKLEPGRPKPLLLEALGDILPEQVWRRPKKGFSLPWESWIGSILRPALEETFRGDSGLARLGIDLSFARALWLTFQAHPERERWSRLWSLHVLSEWVKLNGAVME